MGRQKSLGLIPAYLEHYFGYYSFQYQGGEGKSSVVTVLANNLASRGHKVPVIDMDLNNLSALYYTAGLKDAETISERQNIMIALIQGRAEENIVKTKKRKCFSNPVFIEPL